MSAHPDVAVRRALVVVAHPDDVDFGAGGTVARWTDEAIAVTYCLVTAGDAGGFDPTVDRARIPAIRSAEQRAAARAVGVTDVRVLGYPDGQVSPSYELRRDITRVIRSVRPQRVLLQSPQWNFARIATSHPDHMATGEAAWRAVYPDARNPFAHPELRTQEGLADWKVAEVWMMGGPTPDVAVDVTGTFPRKLAALRAHESQTGHLGDTLATTLRGWLGQVARDAGLGPSRLAEAFNVYQMPD
jgi:LmbE family N-acetylglucosaminyl deacetylase